MNNFNLTDWALRHRAVVLFLLLIVAVAGAYSSPVWANWRIQTSRCRR